MSTIKSLSTKAKKSRLGWIIALGGAVAAAIGAAVYFGDKVSTAKPSVPVAPGTPQPPAGSVPLWTQVAPVRTRNCLGRTWPAFRRERASCSRTAPTTRTSTRSFGSQRCRHRRHCHRPAGVPDRHRRSGILACGSVRIGRVPSVRRRKPGVQPRARAAHVQRPGDHTFGVGADRLGARADCLGGPRWRR